MQNSPANSKKKSTKFFWRAVKVTSEFRIEKGGLVAGSLEILILAW